MENNEKKILIESCELIIGNSNPRFSGVTSTMLQTLAHQKKIMNVMVLGAHHITDKTLHMTFWQAARLLRKPLTNGKNRIFHARRNDEMIQALALRYLFGAKIKIAFTSTAQRHHTFFTRWLIQRMDAIISTCKAAASYLEKKPNIVIAHGVQTDIYTPTENKQAEWDSLNLPGKYGIGIFGRVREQKGVHLFVRACIEVLKELPLYTAVIVGATNPKDLTFVATLKDEVEKSNLENRILFLGERPFNEIPKLFQSMSLVAALSENEGFGLTVLEAMSCGAAVLATDAGAWNEVIREHVDGEIIPTNDYTALVKTMREMLLNHEKLVAMGKSGRKRVLQHYCVKREALELCNFFRTLQ